MIGLVAWISIPKEELFNSLSTEFKTDKISYPLRITGFIASKYEKNGLISRIKADELKLNPRKIFIFNIKSINELTLNNAEIDIYFYENTHSDIKEFSFSDNVLPLQNYKASLKSMGFITRGVINNLVLNIYRGDNIYFFIKAETAYINIKKSTIKLIRAIIKNISLNKLIKSKIIIWNNRKKIFKIPGDYIMLSPMEKIRGKKIEINLNFDLCQ
ncbi:DUF4403 family protein [Candidatus Magnetomoraceae bacterium gMMP-1]